ncbi:MAG TPA: ABC transporter ATP-binding protein [Gammaproteobacteria bacterium]|nr:ABC transporter ATP-binding protein [Gammaproteobacteria bacterium]
MSDDHAIVAENVSKAFLLHHNRVSSLKGRFVGLFRDRWRQRQETFEALHDVSFRVRRGSAFALMGPNGSGKSTLMQLIAGIMEPTGGRITTRGRVAPLIELGVGFNPELTGEENIYLNASLYGFSNKETRRRFKDIVEFSELGHFIDTPVKNYSSGMYMRLGFSVAINLDPEILLADEVLAVGDADFQEKCYKSIQTLQKRGMTLVLVSHSFQLVRQFCDDYVQLKGGRVVEAGSLDELADSTDGSVPASPPAFQPKASSHAKQNAG